jgi:DNA uptake protein ComE-like DNA-binding protein
MNTFLSFLNTADIETLTKVPGISGSIAENIVAARPFESADDCLKVKGMGRSLLARLEAYAEAQENESENRAMTPVKEEAMPAPVEESGTGHESSEEDENLLSRVWRGIVAFLRALLKLILIIALIVVVGTALYYGLPYINRTFIAPVEQNTSEITGLQTEISALRTQVNELTVRVTALEQSAEAHTVSINRLQEMQTMLETELQTNKNQALLDLKHEVMMSRALDTLARGRLYLAQSNFGLAREDVQSARDLLAELQTEKPDDALDAAIARLDLALGNLPAFPVVAAGDLEIAWQILMSGEAPVLPTETPTPFDVETATPSPFPPPTLETTPPQ